MAPDHRPHTLVRQNFEQQAVRHAAVDEFLALHLLTLREHNDRAGDVLDAEQHRAKIEVSIARTAKRLGLRV